MKKILLMMVVLGSFGLLACSGSGTETIVVEKEVVKEIIKEVPVEKEVVKEVTKEIVKIVVATPVPAPVRIQQLVLLQTGNPVGLGADIASSVDENDIAAQFTEPLIMIDPDNNLVPWLAESLVMNSLLFLKAHKNQ